MKKINCSKLFWGLVGGTVLLAGCQSPDPRPVGWEKYLDINPFGSAITTSDIRDVATKMSPSILAVPEIADSKTIKRVQVSEFKNNTRFTIDRTLFVNRLTAELSRYGRSRLRCVSTNARAGEDAEKILRANQSNQIQKRLQEIAAEIAKLPAAQQEKPIKVAVLPVLNVNLINMNGESFIAMLRSRISEASNGKIQFLLHDTPINGADYYLAGQFIPETIKSEGIINLANYIQTVDKLVKSGSSMYVKSVVENEIVPGGVTISSNPPAGTVTTVTSAQTKKRTILETHLQELLRNKQLQDVPDMNKRLNVIIADAKTRASIYERMVLIERKSASRSAYADYLMTGEISAREEKYGDVTLVYLLISMRLIDVENNEVVWDDVHEVRRKINSKVEYK